MVEFVIFLIYILNKKQKIQKLLTIYVNKDNYFCTMKETPLQSLVDYVIAYCNVFGFIITPLKLQKILYYIQAWHIVKHDKHQLFNELPQAWVNGPVYRSVYNTYKVRFYRSTPLMMDRVTTEGESVLEELKNKLNISEPQIDSINIILKHYSSMDEGKLVLLTHNDSPWNEAREGLGEFERCEKYITLESMYSFYSNNKKN